MDHIDIARAFGFKVTQGEFPVSLYAYSPVYRLSKDGQDWVLKRTAKDPKRAAALQSWLALLRESDCRVVSPEPFPGENPRPIKVGEEMEMWVVYPFIQGTPYLGSEDQMRQAGTLLGQIHSVAQKDLGLPQLQSIVPIDREVFKEDRETILQCVRTAMPGLENRALNQLNQFAKQYFSAVFEELIQESFPQVNCTWDFKASNLIFPQGEAPHLIDPDNAGCIPRIYDLAIAALLFHNDGILAQSRALSVPQWRSLRDAYLEMVELTEQERLHWPKILLAVWMDEALWLLANHEDGWTNPRQEKYLADLLLIDLEQFSLN